MANSNFGCDFFFKKQPLIAWTLVALVTIISIAFIFFIINSFSELNKEEEVQQSLRDQMWESVTLGDSLFFNQNENVITYYKKGRKELNETQQSAIDYKREDTLHFFDQNKVHEKIFFQNKSMYLGTCLGKDTQSNQRMLMIEPATYLTKLESTNPFSYDDEPWHNSVQRLYLVDTLSENFYVRFEQVMKKDTVFR